MLTHFLFKNPRRGFAVRAWGPKRDDGLKGSLIVGPPGAIRACAVPRLHRDHGLTLRRPGTNRSTVSLAFCGQGSRRRCPRPSAVPRRHWSRSHGDSAGAGYFVCAIVTRMARTFLYRRPTTGQTVQGWSADEVTDDNGDDTYQSLCVRRLHAGAPGQSENRKGAGRGRGLDRPALASRFIFQRALGLANQIKVLRQFQPTFRR